MSKPDNRKIYRRQEHFWINSSFLIVIAALVGLCTGFGAVGFQKLIEFIHAIFFNHGQNILMPYLGRYAIILFPAAGGLLVGLGVHYLAGKTKGEGVPEVLAAVAEKGGRLNPRLIIDKAVSSALTIGSGGSAGREGPIIQIGAAIGSTIGQILHLSPSMLKTLVACGAAGGISATFNAPIGGVLFAQEIILGEFATRNFILIVISSVSSVIISHIYLGNYPAFMVPAYELLWAGEIFFYILLGILAGFFAVLYIRTLYGIGDLFGSIRLPDQFKPALGGIIVGCIGLYFPQVLGVGYDTVETVLQNGLPFLLVFLLLFVKLIATSMTLGSGAPGGDFAPGLYMGAMLGGSFGFLIHTLFPAITAPAGAYALVAMGGVMAGMYQAPVTAIIMLFEMTGDYKVVLPLMVVCVISSLVARGIYPETLYTEKLARRGVSIQSGPKSVLAGITVKEVMSRDPISLNINLPIEKAWTDIHAWGHTGYPVLKKEKLVGMVTRKDIYRALRDEQENLIIGDIMQRGLYRVTPGDSMETVVNIMSQTDIGRLLVVDTDNPDTLCGIVSRSDVLKAYAIMSGGD